MTKGQIAMIAAESFASKDYGDKAKAARQAGVSEARFSYALTVKEHAPHLVQEVINGKPNMNFDKAYQQALANKHEKEWRRAASPAQRRW